MSTTARHTPGPWALVRDPRRGVGIQAKAGTALASHIAYVQFVGTDLEDGLANAQLIVASPALLAAAQVISLTDHIRSYLEEHDPKALEQLDSAIELSMLPEKPESGRPCGCDPGANWTCDAHRTAGQS